MSALTAKHNIISTLNPQLNIPTPQKDKNQPADYNKSNLQTLFVLYLCNMTPQYVNKHSTKININVIYIWTDLLIYSSHLCYGLLIIFLSAVCSLRGLFVSLQKVCLRSLVDLMNCGSRQPSAQADFPGTCQLSL